MTMTRGDAENYLVEKRPVVNTAGELGLVTHVNERGVWVLFLGERTARYTWPDDLTVLPPTFQTDLHEWGSNL
jgi:hypothetical protein